MAVDYTVTALLASIRRRAMLPTSDQTLSDTDLLALANEEMQSYILPLLLSTCEEYLVVTVPVTVDAGESDIEIPERAVGGKLRDVKVADGTSARSLQRIEPEHRDMYGDSGDVVAFMVEGNNIVLVPSPDRPTTIGISYYRRPNVLVPVDESAVIYDIKTDGYYARAPQVGPTGDSFRADVVSAKPPFSTISEDVADVMAAADGSNFEYTTAENINPPQASVGAYLCVAGTSPVPQIPVELHPLLAQRVAVRALEALGDGKCEQARKVCDEVRASALTLLTPRTEGTGRVIVNHNGPGWRGRRRYY